VVEIILIIFPANQQTAVLQGFKGGARLSSLRTLVHEHGGRNNRPRRRIGTDVDIIVGVPLRESERKAAVEKGLELE
jgi:hypothetical protein